MGNAVTFKVRGNNLLTESLIVTKDMNVRLVYDIVGVIGVGSISNIFKIQRKQEHRGTNATQQQVLEAGIHDSDCNDHVSDASMPVSPQHHYYALKEIDLAQVDPKSLHEFRNEIGVLRRLDHPNIIRAYETYNYTSKDGKSNMIGIILELCEGGDLRSRSPYTEQQAGAILYKVIEAVNYMHQHNFIHRDIKLENIMFESSEPNADIKLIDFGLSTKFWKNENLEQTVGTVYTMAPQVFMGHYTQAADMWSVGVIAFILLSGEEPFHAEKWSQVAKKIVKAEYSFESPAWQSVSEDAKGFVAKLLQYDPSLRYTAEQALNDEWLIQFKPNVDQSIVKDALSRLKQVSCMSDFEKLAWLVAARLAKPSEIAQWRQVFEELDENHDGQISYKEFKSSMIHILGFESKEVAEIFRNVDAQSAGVINYSTFLAALLAVQGKLDDDHLREVFDHFDVDHCGYITHEHLRQILGGEVSDAYIGKLVEEVVQSKNGKIGLDEFKNAFFQVRRENIQ